MRWSDDYDDGASVARFRDVTRPKALEVPWGDKGAGPRGTSDVVTLRPPRLPSISDGDAVDDDFSEALREREEVSGLHAFDARDEPLEGVLPEPTPFAAVPEPEGRRSDTMIDEIVPRAEEEAIVMLRAAIERATSEQHQVFADAEERLVDLALLVARRVIAREVSLDPGIVRGLVREGIQALGEQDKVTVRIGRFFAEMREALGAELANGGLQCDVVVDPALGETGCVVQTALGRVDESVESRLANLLEALPQRSERKGRR